METRAAQLSAVVDLLRRRDRASRSSRGRSEKIRQRFRSAKIQRPGHVLWKSAREIRARIDGIVRSTSCRDLPPGFARRTKNGSGRFSTNIPKSKFVTR